MLILCFHLPASRFPLLAFPCPKSKSKSILPTHRLFQTPSFWHLNLDGDADTCRISDLLVVDLMLCHVMSEVDWN